MTKFDPVPLQLQIVHVYIFPLLGNKKEKHYCIIYPVITATYYKCIYAKKNKCWYSPKISLFPGYFPTFVGQCQY